MVLVVQNTLTGKKEEFKPQKEGKVKMYVCGITPYDESHIGHARCYVVFDVIRRYLEYKKYEVKYIQNFTDIDDKIIARAKELNTDIEKLVNENIDKYFKVMRELNVKAADVYPRVTEHIKDIIEIVSKLVENGYAYEVDGTVYFSVEKYEPYGRLSKRKKEDLVAGARVEVNESKKNPLDFALWKKAKPEEPSWPSPWGRGRPGWHIECSVMSMKHLETDTIDIHGGGRDLIFPHHENEIAQSEAATGRRFSKYWLHNGFVTINKEKMSKSLGNTFTLSDILEKYNPMVLRYFLLTKHYRSPIDFSDDKLEEARKSLYKLKNTIDKIKNLAPEILKTVNTNIKNQVITPENRSNFDLQLAETRKNFEKAMDDDFNTAEAIGYIFRLARYLNTEIDKEGIPLRRVLIKGIEDLKELLNVLGIDIEKVSEDFHVLGINTEEVDALVKQRDEARKNRDWKKSDKIRGQLEAGGYVVEDTPSGTFLKKK